MDLIPPTRVCLSDLSELSADGNDELGADQFHTWVLTSKLADFIAEDPVSTQQLILWDGRPLFGRRIPQPPMPSYLDPL